jgi:site-specific recombinase XerC
MAGDVALSDLATSWTRHLRAEQKAERTVRLYRDAVTYLSRWMDQQGIAPTLDRLTRETVVDYLASCAETNKPGSVLTRFRHIRTFCSFLVAEGELPASPMAGLRAPTVPDDPVPVLADDELTALLRAAARARQPFMARRDEAILRMLVDSGCRRSELAGMQVEGLDLDGGAVWVLGKGSRRRVVMFGARTGRALDRYLRLRRQHRHAHLPALWLSQRGAMSSDGVDDRLRVIAAAAGVDGVHAHRFRHTWADDWLAADGGEQNLKRLAGWRSDAMLARYGASRADARAREAHRRLARGNRI